MGNREITDNLLRKSRMSVRLGRFAWNHVILKTVAAVEEFADVTPDVVGEDEATARVLVNELLDIEN